MRKIQFRGKRKDNKEFAYGDLITGVGEKDGMFFILPVRANLPADCHPLDGYEVYADTIGQFTGLLDKHGKEIYEDDIVQVDNSDEISIFFRDEVCAVEYAPARFSLVLLDERKMLQEDTCQYLTVIGSRFDNPEILKP